MMYISHQSVSPATLVQVHAPNSLRIDPNFPVQCVITLITDYSQQNLFDA